MQMFNFYLYIFSALLQALFCFLIYYAGTKTPGSSTKRTQYSFYVLSASIIIWSLSQYAYDWSTALGFQEAILKVGSIATLLVGIGFTLFTYALIKYKYKFADVIYAVVATAVLLVSVGVTYANIGYDASGNITYTYNFIIYGFISVIPVLFIVRAIFLLLKKAKHYPKDASIARQLRLVARGMILTTLLAFGGNFILIYIIGDNIFSAFLVAVAPAVYTLVIAYTVFSLKLFNFRKFFSNVIIYGSLFIVLYVVAFLPVLLIINALEVSQQAAVTTVVLVSIPLFPLVTKLSKAAFDLLRKRVMNESNATLKNVDDALRTVSSEKLLYGVASVVLSSYGLDRCVVFFVTSDSKESERLMNWQAAGVSQHPASPRDADNFLSLMKTPVLETSGISVPGPFKEYMLAIKIERRGLKGAILLGSKLDGRPIYDDERNELLKIALEVGLGLENSIQYERIQRFNEELEAKIEKATYELRQSNAKLKALDETKDEFISMASHQLRTPLTSVKGYLSMVIEGDAGKLNDMQHKLLDQAFLSSQRMVYLIADLLNVSRLKTGKFIIESVATNLADVIEGEVGQLQETAQARKLTLKYTKPSNFPTLMLDETKIRQVIMNFMDNAIYYTPSGGHITVALVDKPQTIEFTVTDDGIGVPKAEQHKLFAKFYRAGNAQKARPDGTGLGLFMAQKVVIAQGGSIIFHSQEGKGSTFGFSFAKSKLALKGHSVPATTAAKPTENVAK